VHRKDSDIKPRLGEKIHKAYLVDFELLAFLSLALIEDQMEQLKRSPLQEWRRFTDRLIYAQHPLQFTSFKNFTRTLHDLNRVKDSSILSSLMESVNKNFEVSLKKLLVASGSLSQNLCLQHTFPVMLKGQKFIRISPGKNLFSFVGAKYNFELFVVDTKQTETSAFFLRSSAFNGEAEEIEDNLEFSILLSEFFRDINYSSCRRLKNALYVPAFSIDYKSFRDDFRLDKSESRGNSSVNNLQKQSPNETPFRFELALQARNPHSDLHNRLNEPLYRKQEVNSREIPGSMNELDSVAGSLTQLNEESHRLATMSPTPKVKRKQTNACPDPNPQAKSTMFSFSASVEFSGSGFSNGLIYLPGHDDVVFSKRFVFGLLHRDVETLFLHPTLSFLVEPAFYSDIL